MTDHPTEERMFPVLIASGMPQCSVPWAFVLPHEPQARANHYQSLGRLAERGGLAWSELAAVLQDRSWEKMQPGEDRLLVEELLASWRQEQADAEAAAALVPMTPPVTPPAASWQNAWQNALPALIGMLAQGDADSRRANAELVRMARLADAATKAACDLAEASLSREDDGAAS